MEGPKIKKHSFRKENPYQDRNSQEGPGPDSVRPDGQVPYGISIATSNFRKSLEAKVDESEAISKVRYNTGRNDIEGNRHHDSTRPTVSYYESLNKSKVQEQEK